MMSDRGRLALLVLAAYAGLSFLMMGALLVRAGNFVPDGPGTDYSHFIWNYWWMGYALENGLSLWQTDYVLYPHQHNLSLHTLTPLWFPAYAVTAPIFGQIATANLILWVSFALSGWAMWWWLRGYTTSAGLAFAGGLLYAFQPYVQVSASAMHFNLVALWWLPLIACLWREVVTPRLIKRRAVTVILLGLALWGSWLTDLQWPLFLAFTVVPYGLWTLWTHRHRIQPLLIAGFASAGIMAALALLVWPLPQVGMTDTGDPFLFPPAGLQTIRDWAIPLSALIGDRSDMIRRLGLTVPYLLFFIPLIGLLIWRRGRAALWLWLAATIPPTLLMLGADVVIGETVIRLPYSYLHDALSGQFRTPERFVFPALFNAVTFAVLFWSPLVRRWQIVGRVALVAVIFVLIADLALLRTFPTRELRDYPIHHEIGDDPREYVVLDLPLAVHYGWTGMGRGHHTQIYAIRHQKRVVNGFLARMPYTYFAYYADSPLFTWLANGDDRPPEEMARIQAQFDAYVDEWPVGYVFAHLEWMPPERILRWVGWMNAHPDFCQPRISEDGLLIWWRHSALDCPPVTVSAMIDIGAADDWVHLGAGWHYAESFGGRSARWAEADADLYLHLAPDAAYRLTFSAVAFERAREVVIAGQTLTITADDWGEYSVDIRRDDLHNGRLLAITHTSADSPAALFGSADSRQLAAAYARFDIVPLNAEESR